MTISIETKTSRISNYLIYFSAMNAATPCKKSLRPDMSILNMIDKYQSYARQLVEAIEKEDDSVVLKMDQLIEEEFQQILNFQAKDAEEQCLQAEFLLEQLATINEPSERQKDINKKLLNIIKQQN